MSMRPMKFWPTSLPSVPTGCCPWRGGRTPRAGGAQRRAPSLNLAAWMQSHLVLDGDVACLATLARTLGALVGVALLGPPGEAALLGEGAGVVALRHW